MASTTQTHPAFPARNYSNIHNKLPDRNRETGGGGGGGGNAFGAPSRNQNPEVRAPAQGGSSAPSNSLQSITDEQREEINEAVSGLTSSLFWGWGERREHALLKRDLSISITL